MAEQQQAGQDARFKEWSNDLHSAAALLAGIEDICRAEEIGGNALCLAGEVCRQINNRLCLMADALYALAKASESAGG